VDGIVVGLVVDVVVFGSTEVVFGSIELLFGFVEVVNAVVFDVSAVAVVVPFDGPNYKKCN